MNQSYYDDIRGAVYIPSRAYNAYQMWRDYDGQEARRDLGYAASVNLNALRIWVSYEFWNEDPRAVSGNPRFEAEEFRELPLWYQKDLKSHG